MLRNRKRFYYSNGENKAERDVFKTMWVHWTQEWRQSHELTKAELNTSIS